MRKNILNTFFHNAILIIITFLIILSNSCSTKKEISASPVPSFTASPILTATATLKPTDTPTPSQTPTPTPTPIPLVERDLSLIVLQPADVPSDYTNIKHLDGPDEFKEVWPKKKLLHENLLNAYYSSFYTKDRNTGVESAIFVYNNEANAQNAFTELFPDPTDEPLVSNKEVQIVGDETVAWTLELTMVQPTYYVATIRWRYKEAIMYITRVNKTNTGIEDVVALAQVIQSRVNPE